MITPRYVQTLARYNTHMNDAVVRTVDKLSPEAREEQRGAFFGSISATLQHILWADGVWMARFQGLDHPGGSFDHRVAESWDSYKQLRGTMDLRIAAWADSLEQAWLDADFRWRSVSGGEHEKAAGLLVTHLFNHATHHRGQVTTLLSQAGFDVGTTDLALLM